MTPTVPTRRTTTLPSRTTGTRPDAPDAEDRDLGMVDDRGLEEPGELARARHRERRPAQVTRVRRACACRVREPLDLGSDLVDAPRRAVADDGDEQALVGLHRDAHVVAVEEDDLVAFEPRVELGELGERGG